MTRNFGCCRFVFNRFLAQRQEQYKETGKARIRVAQLCEHIANRRRDMTQKLSTALVRGYDLIAVEDLAPENMVKNHRLAKSVADASRGEFRRQSEYKARWYGKTVVTADRFFPSDRLCSACGARWFGTKDLSMREWTCPVCGSVNDREDVNAAKNIPSEGLRLLV